jgi:hypothetical protein
LDSSLKNSSVRPFRVQFDLAQYAGLLIMENRKAKSGIAALLSSGLIFVHFSFSIWTRPRFSVQEIPTSVDRAAGYCNQSFTGIREPRASMSSSYMSLPHLCEPDR